MIAEYKLLLIKETYCLFLWFVLTRKLTEFKWGHWYSYNLSQRNNYIVNHSSRAFIKEFVGLLLLILETLTSLIPPGDNHQTLVAQFIAWLKILRELFDSVQTCSALTNQLGLTRKFLDSKNSQEICSNLTKHPE